MEPEACGVGTGIEPEEPKFGRAMDPMNLMQQPIDFKSRINKKPARKTV